MLVQTQQQINTDIIVDTTISNNKQSFIAPEIIFINKPYLVNKRSYYKMFVNLNLNLYIMNDSDYHNTFNLFNLDFKLYSSDLKEIKLVQSISKTYKINSQEKTYFEYQLRTDLKKDHVINLNFGLSHDFNQINYKSKGEIRLNSEFVKVNNKVNLNVVSCLSYYDYFNNIKKLNSESILKAEVNINNNALEVNKRYQDLFDLNIKYNKLNMHLLNGDQNLIDEIEQIKNGKIFPPFKINSVELGEKKEFETYYSGDLNLSILNNNDNYQIVYNRISELDEKTKIVNLKTGDKGLYINPYNWNKKQELIIKLNIFGEEYIISNQIKSYAKYLFVQDYKFNVNPIEKYTYKLNNAFWTVISLLTFEEMKELLKTYEIL